MKTIQKLKSGLEKKGFHSLEKDQKQNLASALQRGLNLIEGKSEHKKIKKKIKSILNVLRKTDEITKKDAQILLEFVSILKNINPDAGDIIKPIQDVVDLFELKESCTETRFNKTNKSKNKREILKI